MLNFQIFQFCLRQFQVPLRFKILFAQPIELHRLRVNIEPIFAFKILLYSHPQYILVYRQRHLRVDMIDLLLLSFNHVSHMLDAHFLLLLQVLPGSDLFNEPVLIACALILYHLEVLLKIIEQLRQLILLSNCVLQYV